MLKCKTQYYQTQTDSEQITAVQFWATWRNSTLALWSSSNRHYHHPGSWSSILFPTTSVLVGRDTRIWLCFPAYPAVVPPPSALYAFPPTPLGREEVARWLMSLGSNVPLCNMKPWVWKKAREAPSGFYFYFVLFTFLLFRQTSISFRVVSAPDLSSGVDASNHAGDTASS